MSELLKDAANEIGDHWLDDYLPYQLYRISNLMNVRLQRQLRGVGMNLSRWRVLCVLRSDGRLSISKIVELTLMEQPTVSRVVANLEEEGMIDRRVSEEDSRVMEIALTEKGTAVIGEVQPAAVNRQRAALDGVTASDLATFRRVLARITDNIARDL